MIDELKKIQSDYLDLLTNFRNISNQEDISFHLVQIGIFWYRRKRTIELCSRYLFHENETYVYTGTSRFNLNNNENNILFALGKFQIFDDPLVPYLEVINKNNISSRNEKYIYKLKEKIITLIEENISLLELNIPYFFILPMRFLYNIDNNKEENDIKQLVDQFFKSKIDITSLSNDTDINLLVNKKLLTGVLFSDEDNPTLPIAERLTNYRIEFSSILPTDFNDIELLYFILTSNFAQTVDILNTCFYFETIPFFSNNTCYINLYFLLHNLVNISNNKKSIELLNKLRITFTIWKIYTNLSEELSSLEIKERAKKIQITKKMEKIYEDINSFTSQDELALCIEELLSTLLDKK